VIGRIPVVICALSAPLLAASPATSQDRTPFDWRGFYLGYASGGALSFADVDNPFGRSIFGSTVRTPGAVAGGELGYNWQFGRNVLGVETDANWAELEGTNTCFAFSGYYVSANCRGRIDALGTLAGRYGWTFGDSTLLYGKAGLAWAQSKTQATPNGGLGLVGHSDSGLEWGWTLGAGIERAISPRWTVKAEYGFLSFGDQSFLAPTSRSQPNPPVKSLVDVPAAKSNVSQDIHLFEIGMNHKLGPGSPALANAASRPSPQPAHGIAVTLAARYMHGWGEFHKDLGLQRRGDAALASRLTYEDTSSDGGEGVARIDTGFGLMLKGLVGGALGAGRLNDEDWGLPIRGNFVPYSNTLSNMDDNIDYGIADIGYDWWRGAGYSVAPFVGYTQFHQDMKAYGCRQIANRFSDCVPPIPASTLGITEDDTWRALRLGTAVDVVIAPRLMLAADAAYLPYVQFRGTDDHVLRHLLSPEEGNGTGVQLEAMLSYDLTDAFSLGVGGRYWSLWTNDGTVNFGGTGTIVAMRYAAEQAQLLVQGSYKFGVAR
jgi:opacity protein-like surface antigen